MLLAARLARQAASLRVASSATTAPSTSGRAVLVAAWKPAGVASVNWAPRRAARSSLSSTPAASPSDRIEPPDVRKLAAMATIAVTDEEVAAWEPTLQKIAGWFDQLQAVDVEGVPPATDAGVGGGSSLRADEVDVSLAGAEDALGQVPERTVDGFVRVPKV